MSAELPPMPDRWARVYKTHTANPSWNQAAAAQEPQMGPHIGVVRYVAVPDSFLPAVCPMCSNRYVIATSRPDEFGNYDTDDCPCQILDEEALGRLYAELREEF